MRNEKNKPGVMFYFDYLELIGRLRPMQRLAVYEAMIHYSMEGTEPVLPREAALLWGFIKPILDRDAERYERVVAARVKGGKARGTQIKKDAEGKLNANELSS